MPWVLLADDLECYFPDDRPCANCASRDLNYDIADCTAWCEQCGMTWGGLWDTRWHREWV